MLTTTICAMKINYANFNRGIFIYCARTATTAKVKVDSKLTNSERYALQQVELIYS